MLFTFFPKRISISTEIVKLFLSFNEIRKVVQIRGNRRHKDTFVSGERG